MYRKMFVASLLGLGLFLSQTGWAGTETWMPRVGQVITFREVEVDLDTNMSLVKAFFLNRRDRFEQLRQIVRSRSYSDYVLTKYEITKVDEEKRVFTYIETRTQFGMVIVANNVYFPPLQQLHKSEVTTSFDEYEREMNKVRQELDSCPVKRTLRIVWNNETLKICDLSKGSNDMRLISNEVPFFVYFESFIKNRVNADRSSQKVLIIKELIGVENKNGMKVNH